MPKTPVPILRVGQYVQAQLSEETLRSMAENHPDCMQYSDGQLYYLGEFPFRIIADFKADLNISRGQ